MKTNKNELTTSNNLKNIGILIAGIAVFYFLVIYIPGLNRNKLKKQRLINEAEIAKNKPYNDCIQEEENYYNSRNDLANRTLETCGEINEFGNCKNGGNPESIEKHQTKLLEDLEKAKKDCAIKYKH